MRTLPRLRAHRLPRAENSTDERDNSIMGLQCCLGLKYIINSVDLMHSDRRKPPEDNGMYDYSNY